MLLYSNEKMSPWPRFLAEHSVLGKEIQLQELCASVSSLQDIKVDSRDPGCGHFQVTSLVLLQPPLASAAQARCLPTCLPPTPQISGRTTTVQTLGSNFLVQLL